MKSETPNDFTISVATLVTARSFMDHAKSPHSSQKNNIPIPAEV